jgi:hypothetical protein
MVLLLYQQALLRARATVLIEHSTDVTTTRLPIDLMQVGTRKFATRRKQKAYARQPETCTAYLFFSIRIYEIGRSCSAIDRVNSVSSEPLCSVVTVSISAIQVSSVAEVL